MYKSYENNDKTDNIKCEEKIIPEEIPTEKKYKKNSTSGGLFPNMERDDLIILILLFFLLHEDNNDNILPFILIALLIST